MFQKTSKTLYYMEIMVSKIPPGGGGMGAERNPFWSLAYMFLFSNHNVTLMHVSKDRGRAFLTKKTCCPLSISFPNLLRSLVQNRSLILWGTVIMLFIVLQTGINIVSQD